MEVQPPFGFCLLPFPSSAFSGVPLLPPSSNEVCIKMKPNFKEMMKEVLPDKYQRVEECKKGKEQYPYFIPVAEPH
jgi:hypothetical protein